MSTQTNFNAAYEIGLDAVDALSKSPKVEAEASALAGILSAIIHAAYFMANGDDETVDAIVNFAQETARKDAAKERAA